MKRLLLVSLTLSNHSSNRWLPTHTHEQITYMEGSSGHRVEEISNLSHRKMGLKYVAPSGHPLSHFLYPPPPSASCELRKNADLSRLGTVQLLEKNCMVTHSTSSGYVQDKFVVGQVRHDVKSKRVRQLFPLLLSVLICEKNVTCPYNTLHFSK